MELKHYGTEGQKWGVRLYQNEDGSLTPAGKLRYSSTYNTEHMSKKEVKNLRKEYKDASRRLSSDELQELISRANLEKQYLDTLGVNAKTRGESIASSIKENFNKLLIKEVSSLMDTAVAGAKSAAISAYNKSRGKDSGN